MRGEIDYKHDKIVISGEICERILDTWLGITERLRMNSGVTVSLHENDIACTDIISVLEHWQTHGTVKLTQEVFGDNYVRTLLSRLGCTYSPTTELFFTCGRGTSHNVYVPFHSCVGRQEDKPEFQVTIKKPLPPSYINRMLQSYQGYLKVWDRVGDDNVKWTQRQMRDPNRW
jgi:hypothetical protein